MKRPYPGFQFVEQIYVPVIPRPGAPTGPVGPEGPEGPIWPVAPVLPLRPLAPGEPLEPGKPAGPVAPVKPLGPREPVAPVCPVGPVNPVKRPILVNPVNYMHTWVCTFCPLYYDQLSTHSTYHPQVTVAEQWFSHIDLIFRHLRSKLRKWQLSVQPVTKIFKYCFRALVPQLRKLKTLLAFCGQAIEQCFPHKSSALQEALRPLTHCGLVTWYGNRDLGQHWLR